MSFVVYHKETTIIPRLKKSGYWSYHEWFTTIPSAKGALTRAENEGRLQHPKDQYAIAETNDFFDNIEKQVTRKNLISGKEFVIDINCPPHLDPSTETYWSL